MGCENGGISEKELSFLRSYRDRITARGSLGGRQIIDGGRLLEGTGGREGDIEGYDGEEVVLCEVGVGMSLQEIIGETK